MYSCKHCRVVSYGAVIHLPECPLRTTEALALPTRHRLDVAVFALALATGMGLCMGALWVVRWWLGGA